MKKTIGLVFIAAVVAFVFACHKDSDVQPQSGLKVENAPSAKPADDAKSSGVYKGTLVGSSGSFKLNIVANEIVGYLRVDNDAYTLRTTDITAADLGKVIVNAHFKDDAGKAQFVFSVNADGSNPHVTATVEGHPNIQVVVVKELSTQAIRVFEGFLYTADTQMWVQTKAAFNIVLGDDSTSLAIYKVIEEYPIVPGSQHNRPADWSGITYYHVAPFGGKDYLWDYRLDTLNYNQQTYLQYHYLFAGTDALYTDNLIVGKTLRMINMGHEMWDSVRLVRKL